jgi:hypothetical protein
MAKIRKDELGTYANVGGYVVRPIEPTKFKEGDNTEGKHFGGSRIVGMGKLPGRSKYAEYWKTWSPENEKYDPWLKYF